MQLLRIAATRLISGAAHLGLSRRADAEKSLFIFIPKT
jgi:hypothetical protein